MPPRSDTRVGPILPGNRIGHATAARCDRLDHPPQKHNYLFLNNYIYSCTHFRFYTDKFLT